MPPTLGHVLGLTALVQCLVYDLSQEIDRGTYQYDCHPFMVRQNKWRACRYGMEANLVDPATFQSVPARQVVALAVDRLADRGEELGCAATSRISASSPRSRPAPDDSSAPSRKPATWPKSSDRIWRSPRPAARAV